MKNCSVDGCMGFVFSKGLCLKHWKHKFQKPIPSSLKNMPKVSRKRIKQVKNYHLLIKSMDGNNIMPVCFFCGKRVEGIISHHHLMGRDGDKLTDEKYIVPSHNSCHVDDYHSKSVSILMTRSWYNDFLLRLKKISTELWREEIYKQVKARIITIEQYNELTHE